jgi:hypothetical protein
MLSLENLAPDATFIHSSTVKVNQPVNTMGAGTLEIKAITESAERLLTRALKTMPLLMGLAEGTSEANANRQWEIHVASIKSIQHIVENCVGSLLEAGLQAGGIQCRIELRFAELRAAEMLRDAQTEALRIANAQAKRREGWISHEEASIEVTGKPPAEKEPPQPLDLAANAQQDEEDEEGDAKKPDIGETENADPGQNRMADYYKVMERMGATAAIAIAERLKNEQRPTAEEIERAIRWWDEAVPAAKGLADAEPWKN